MISCQQKSNRQIYNELYEKGYPTGGPGFPISWSGIDCSQLRCLDIGCGHAVLCKRFKHYTGCDISDYIISEDLLKYPESDFFPIDAKFCHLMKREFDIVLAIDTLEHFPSEEIEQYLESISKVNTRMFLFSICCRPAGIKGIDGEQLHTCIKSREEWIELLDRYFNIIDKSELNRQQTFCVKAEKI